MKTIELNYQELRKLTRFTDPLMHSLEKEEEIMNYFNNGKLKPPSLVKDDKLYLIFNGNHRVLVAINNKLTICCRILENINDISKAQNDEGELYRDLSMISPLTFEGVLKDLRKSAIEWSNQNPDNFVCDY